MRYLGGKSKIAKRLAACILENTDRRARLLEPFVGGGAMTAALAPHFAEVRAYDVHEDLILMWRALQRGWAPPSHVSEDEYRALRGALPSPLRGFVGFGGASWGGKWFGGYARGGARNYADESARSLRRDVALMQNVTFDRLDYRLVCPNAGDVVYCDPPYAGATGYESPFDSTEFWTTMALWVEDGAHVFVSEYQAPNDWTVAWEATRTRDMKSQLTNAVRVTERLFTKHSPAFC